METVDSALAAADRALRRYGIGPADRVTLLADLRLDLQAAAADGVDPARLLGPDVGGFARRLADEAGVTRTGPELGQLVGTAVTGAALGAAIGAALLAVGYPLLARLVDLPRSIHVPVQVAVAVFYGVPAVLVAAGAVLAVRVSLRNLPRIRRTARLMILLLPLAGLLITPLTMAFAWATGYSTAPPVLLVEIALVLGALSGATVLARHWSLRTPHPGLNTPAAVTPLA
ncbi:hypothetical protein ACWKSP_31055 [Micromonosporaceae bacterium Da 78-11]